MGKRKRKIKLEGLVSVLLTVTLAYMMLGCSAVKFDRGSDAPSTAQSAQGGGGGDAAGDDGASGTITQGAGPNGGDISNSGGAAGTITGVGSAPAAELPKVRFIGPPCQRLTNCEVTFELDKSYSRVTEFDWKTNDSLYGTPAQAGLPPWGKPGFEGDASAQYVPTSGHVVFPAGVTRRTVYVRNINQQNLPISIGVIMSQCVYGSLLESCQKFFAQ